MEVQHTRSRTRAALMVPLRAVSAGLTWRQAREAWPKWRRMVLDHSIGDVPLGRCVECLQRLPQSLWHAPLSSVVAQSIDQLLRQPRIGRIKTWNIIRTVARIHHSMTCDAVPRRRAVTLIEPHMAELQWAIGEWLRTRGPWDWQLLQQSLLAPLLGQIELDAGGVARSVVENRLRLDGRRKKIEQHARRLGCTRSWIHQLLRMPARVILMRWPEGAAHWQQLCTRAQRTRQLPVTCHWLAAIQRIVFARDDRLELDEGKEGLVPLLGMARPTPCRTRDGKR